MVNEPWKFLYQYMYNKEIFLQNDLVQVLNNLRLREPDDLDYLEIMMARHKLTAAQEIFADIRVVLRMIQKL